ncbi:hypothetical protein WA026_017926 [Henosepilachna vigintioctopunctata]|uniref:Carboxylic ester hydrolase n=1 Tax=Henosepilachna vigintioctopunctata TaxID=420089 RepID=A0AAW1TUU2_9CUCU
MNSCSSGTEDCLYMYIYVPKKRISRYYNFDVVVHMHGGSLVVGSPYENILPDYLMDKNIILVAFNYRLGAAGFFSTGDSVVAGNNGFKDQVLALKWIKENIKEFGGKPSSITITGWSSGGQSVQFHYLSPMSRGLFHRGFSSSGVVTNPDALTLIPKENAKRLAESLNCGSRNTNQMVDCLKRLPIEKLVNTSMAFKPSVEKGIVNGFLPEHPYKLLKDKKVYDVPWVAANVVNESLYSLDSVYNNRSEVFSIYNNWLEWGRVWLDLEEYVEQDKMNDTLNRIKAFYMDSTKLTEQNGLEKLNRLLTDRHFLVGTDLAVRTHAAATRSNVYFYLFKFIPEDRLQFGGPPAASHGVDNKLLFKDRANPNKLQHEGEKMMREFTDFMAEYAMTGIPKIKKNLPPIIRPESCLNILEINSPDDIQPREVTEIAPRAFWNSLPIKENNHLY